MRSTLAPELKCVRSCPRALEPESSPEQAIPRLAKAAARGRARYARVCSGWLTVVGCQKTCSFAGKCCVIVVNAHTPIDSHPTIHHPFHFHLHRQPPTFSAHACLHGAAVGLAHAQADDGRDAERVYLRRRPYSAWRSGLWRSTTPAPRPPSCSSFAQRRLPYSLFAFSPAAPARHGRQAARSVE